MKEKLIAWARSAPPLLWISLGILILTRISLVLVVDVRPTSDMGWYYGRAIELIETGSYAENGIITAFWPVGYPAFLAGVMLLGGTSVLTGQIANLVLSLVSAILLYLYCNRQFGDQRIGSYAVLLLAIYPNHMGYTLGLYTEPLFSVLLLLLMLLAAPNGSRLRFAFVGIVAGFAALVKTQALMLVLPMVFLLTLSKWGWDEAIRAGRIAMFVTAVMLLTVAPWTLRNYMAMDAFIPISTNGGMSLLAGNNPSMTRDLRSDFNDKDPVFNEVRFSVADQVAADKRARNAAWEWISENPLQFVALMPKKLFRFWVPDGETEWNLQRGFEAYDEWKTLIRSVRIANQIYYFILLGTFLFGIWHCVRLNNPLSLAVPFVMLFFTALSLVFSGQSRYHAPLMPFVIAYAAWFLNHKFVHPPSCVAKRV